jgi:flagellar biosynthesis/type III secretory pathway M-ring protein FliF/YscJ
MYYPVILADMPYWAILLLILLVFGVIALGVFLVRKFAKPFRNDEKPKSDREIAEEEVQRMTQELDEEELRQSEEAKARKNGKPTEEEARQEALNRVLQPTSEEEAKAMNDYAASHADEAQKAAQAAEEASKKPTDK